MNNIVKNTFFLNASSVIEKLAFFFINLIIARYLSVETYGEYAAALGLATFFSLFTNVGIENTLMRNIKLYPEKEKETLSMAIVLKTILALLVFIIVCAILFLSGYQRSLIYLTIILIMVRMGNEYMLTVFAYLNAKEKFFIISAVISLFSVSLLGSTAAVIALEGNYFHLSFIRLFVILFFLAVAIILIAKKIIFRINFSEALTFIKTTIPFGWSGMLGNIAQRSNIVILTAIASSSDVGIFNNGYILISSLSFIPANVERLLLPMLYDNYKMQNHNQLQFIFDKTSKIMHFISIAIISSLFFYSEFVIEFLFGEKFILSAQVLRISSFILLFLFSPVAQIMISNDKQKILAKINTVNTAINVGLCFWLGTLFSYTGISSAMVIVFFLYYTSIIVYLRSKRIIMLKYYFITLFRFVIALSILVLVQYFLISKIIINNFILQNLVRITLFLSTYLLLFILIVADKSDKKILNKYFSAFNEKIII